MMARTRRLTAAVVATGIVAVAGAVMDRAEGEGSPAIAGVSNGTALAQPFVADIGEAVSLTPAVALEAALLEGVEPVRSPREAHSRGEPGRPFDLAALEREIRETPAIGFLAKLRLDHDVRQLVGDFQRYHGGDDSVALEVLGERFDRLLRGVVKLLRDDDPALAERIAAARGVLWDLLTDPEGNQWQTVGL
jgi:hypothetical protein